MPKREDAICPHGWQRAACAKCRSKRNKTFGQAVQREMHQALGGTGWTPHHEETGRGYMQEYVTGADAVLALFTCHDCEEGVTTTGDRCLTCQGTTIGADVMALEAREALDAVVKVHPEAKGGKQIPAALVKFLETDWYRRALSQSQRSLPVGSGAMPAVWCHLPGGRKVLIVDFGGGRGKV